MKLDTPLDIKGPYNVRGTVDVYFSNGRWLARSWPKRPKQPNSQSQISVREKFKAMLAARARMTTYESDLWKGISLPPDKTWDDLWRGNYLKTSYSIYSSTLLNRPFQIPIHYFGFKWPSRPPAIRYATYLCIEAPQVEPFPWDGLYWYTDLAGVPDITWAVNGMLCYSGKKQIPHYVPSVPEGAIVSPAADSYNLGGTVFRGWLTEATSSYSPIRAFISFPYTPQSYDIKSYVILFPSKEYKTIEAEFINPSA